MQTMLYQKMTVPIGQLAEIGMSFHRIRVNLRDAVNAEKPADSEGFIKRAEELLSVIDKTLPEYEKTLFTDGGRNQYEELKSAIDSFPTLIS